MRLNDLMESWWDRVGSVEELAAMKDEILANPGADVDVDSMTALVPQAEDEPHEVVLSEFFDYLIRTFRRISRDGRVGVYRCVSVADFDGFIGTVEAGAALGIFWTHDMSAASCDYHSDPNHPVELLLAADAPVGSIDWASSMTTNLAHPYEAEIRLLGPVENLRVLRDGRVVFAGNGSYRTE